MTIMITAMSKTLCCRHYLLASCPSGSKWPPRAFPKVAARIETWVWGVMMLMATILTVSCLLVFARNMIKIKISTTCYTLSSKSTGLVLCTVFILIFGSHHFLLFRSHALGTKSGSSTIRSVFCLFCTIYTCSPLKRGVTF